MTKHGRKPDALGAAIDGSGAASPANANGVGAAARLPEICGDLEMRIARDGTWFYHGSPIGRKRLVKLFASVLRREDDGDYYLVTPAEKGRIVVEDAPFVAVAMDVTSDGQDQRLTFRTNIDEEVVADDAHPIRVDHDQLTGEPAPYVLVRDGLDALIGRAVYYDLVERGVEKQVDGETLYGVWSCGVFFPLGRAEA
jgi:hypothetical protein